MLEAGRHDDAQDDGEDVGDGACASASVCGIDKALARSVSFANEYAKPTQVLDIRPKSKPALLRRSLQLSRCFPAVLPCG